MEYYLDIYYTELLKPLKKKEPQQQPKNTTTSKHCFFMGWSKLCIIIFKYCKCGIFIYSAKFAQQTFTIRALGHSKSKLHYASPNQKNYNLALGRASSYKVSVESRS